MSLARWSHTLHYCAVAPEQGAPQSGGAATPAILAFGGAGRDVHKPMAVASEAATTASKSTSGDEAVGLKDASTASSAPEAASATAPAPREAGAGADGTWLKRKDFVRLKQAEKKAAQALARSGAPRPAGGPSAAHVPTGPGALNGRLSSVAVALGPFTADFASTGLSWSTAPAAAEVPAGDATCANGSAAAGPCAREHHVALTVALPRATHDACFPATPLTRRCAASASATEIETTETGTTETVDCVVVHGGRRGPARPLADLWLYSPMRHAWRCLLSESDADAAVAAGAAPAPRFRHAAAALGSTLYVHGGRGAHPVASGTAEDQSGELCVYGDVWRLNLALAPAVRWKRLYDEPPHSDLTLHHSDVAASSDTTQEHACERGPGPRLAHSLTPIARTCLSNSNNADVADEATSTETVPLLWLHGGLSSLRLHDPPAAGEPAWLFCPATRRWHTRALTHCGEDGTTSPAAAPRVYSHRVVALPALSSAAATAARPARFHLIIGGSSPHVRAFTALWVADTHAMTLTRVAARADTAAAAQEATAAAAAGLAPVTGGALERLWVQPALTRALLLRHAAVALPGNATATPQAAAGDAAETVAVAGGGSLCFSFGSYDSPSLLLTVTRGPTATAAMDRDCDVGIGR